MKIQDPSGVGRPERPGPKAQTPRGPSAPEPSALDRVEISTYALRIAQLAEEARALPELRTDHVEQIRQALADGSYRADPRAVARAAVEFEDALAR
jgi:flagellar biosynthesis anti-sigma factor FlgM